MTVSFSYLTVFVIFCSRSPSPTPSSPGPQSPTLNFSISMNDVISPDSDGTHSGTGSHDSQSREGFYLLRKDSERRLTLVHMLSKESDFQRVRFFCHC